jgi:hypothetical protein
MSWLLGALRPCLGGSRTTRRHRATGGEALERRHLLAQVAGAISEDTVWALTDSPFEVTGNVTVQPGARLTIEPGVVVQFRGGTGLNVRGQLVAEGTADARILFERTGGAGTWDGLSFDDTLADNRIRYADMIRGDGQGEAIDVDRSRLLLDHIVWSGTTETILELEHPSLIVRNSQFPASDGSEIIHGEHLSGDEYLIIEGNTFAPIPDGDLLDFLGADRPGPVLQVLNNVFLGGGDDGLDLDGTDAHIEGNVFMNFRRDTNRPTTSNAIATGLPQSGELNSVEITVVRNLFINNDHAILLKENAFATIENNVFVDNRLAAIQFGEVGGTAVLGPGKGAALSGNIFWNNRQLFKNLVDTNNFQTLLTVNQSLLPNEVVDFDGTPVNAHDLGAGNIDADPQFVDAAARNYRLQADSPAKGAGPLGLDMGAFVSGQPVVVAQTPVSTAGGVEFAVGGPGITHYRYRLADEPLSPLRPLSEPIQLQGLAAGTHQLEVVGMNSAGEWVTGQATQWQERTYQVLAPSRVRPGEALPLVARALNWQGATDTAFGDVVSLQRGGQADQTLLFRHGVAAATSRVDTDTSYSITLPGTDRNVEVLPDDFPVEAVQGTLAGNIHWTADREYHVTDDLTIAANGVLTIDPGTRVLLSPRVNVTVNGQLRSMGTASDPVLFHAAQQQPWGGLEFVDAEPSQLSYTFLTHGGGDTSKVFGHSDSQPMLRVNRSSLDCNNCFLINNAGKGFGTSNSRVNIFDSVLSYVDTGGEFGTSVVDIRRTWVMDIPDNRTTFVDDDNDGFYFSSTHASGEPSRFVDSFVIDTNDDGLDHNGARLEIVRAWIEGTTHEGLAASNGQWASVTDSVVIGANQGIEAGYGSPDVTVRQSVIFGNRTTLDPEFPITAGLRFGDGYDGSIDDYLGHITAAYDVLHDNGDNVRNYDGTIPGPKPGAIDITNSLANDPDAVDPSNLTGVPVFGVGMHLLRGSAGFTAGPDGMPVGRIVPATIVEFVVPGAGDFNDDGALDAVDLGLLCAAILAADPAAEFDLTGDGQVDQLDRDSMVFDQLQTTYGDSNLDGIFNSADLVAVFAIGQYEDGVASNSSWADGDWDCDGDFDSGDIVLAFQTGGYSAQAIDRALASDWE